MARSFQEDDDRKVEAITNLLDSFRPLGLVWETTERTEIESVSRKVRGKIDDCDIFVAIFTRRHPIFDFTESKSGAPLEPASVSPTGWTGPPWLYQETGYALKAGKKLLLIREHGVELPTLQGDLEYVLYDPDHPETAWTKVHEVLTRQIADNVGIGLDHVVSGPEPRAIEQELAVDSPALLPAPAKQDMDCIDELVDSARSKDFGRAARAQEEGMNLIKAGTLKFDEVVWQSLCWQIRGSAGEHSAAGHLRELVIANPVHTAPLIGLANLAREFKEYKSAGDLYVKAAEIKSDSGELRIRAAREYRSAQLWELAVRQLDIVLSDDSIAESVKANAYKEMFWTLNDSGDQVAAFCFGEAALKLVPNDSDFRFQLAYAYGDATGGYEEHDYRDLALAHYELLVQKDSASEYAHNNLGVVYNAFKAPIHAAEEFRTASMMGNALATANVLKQYLLGGFVRDAEVWADAHKPSSDDKGDITQALAVIHAERRHEQERLDGVLARESNHRTALSDLATSRYGGEQPNIDGAYQFPVAIFKMSRHDDMILGSGPPSSSTGGVLHQFNANCKNRLWRFDIASRKEGSYLSSDTKRSFGLMRFSPNGEDAIVLEYHTDGAISSYTVRRLSSVDANEGAE